jgi:hypothetical protein
MRNKFELGGKMDTKNVSNPERELRRRLINRLKGSPDYTEGILRYPEKPLYYYMDARWLWPLLNTGELRAGHMRFSNDSQEYIIGKKVVDQLQIENWRELKCEDTDILQSFFICFSEKRDSRAQWSEYCRGSIGVAIEFDFSQPNYCWKEFGREQINGMQVYFNEGKYKYPCFEIQDKRSKEALSEHESRLHIPCISMPRKVLYVNPDSFDIEENFPARYHIKNSIDSVAELLISTTNLEEAIPRLLPMFSREDLIPFVKHWTFWEESEYRLIFNLHDWDTAFRHAYSTFSYQEKEVGLDSYIQYAEDSQKVKRLPGIFLKCKHPNEDFDCSKDSYLRLDQKITQNTKSPTILEYSDLNDMENKLKQYIGTKDGENMKSLTIPQGKNQVETFERVEETLGESGRRQMNKDNMPDDNFCFIWCNGHWPIRGIIVERVADSELLRDQIANYCKQHHWLKDIYVCESSIPYRKR